MEPDLWELLEDGHRQDEVAAIIRLGPGQNVPPGVRVISRFGNIATIRLARGDVPKIDSSAEVIGMAAGWSYLGPDIDSDARDSEGTAIDYVPASDDRRPSKLSSTGRGVVVGVTDWGFDFAHADFRRPDGGSRIVALWDQRGGALPGSPAPFGYGRVYDRVTIDRALATHDPYAALGYHPGDADSGAGSHGTHVTSIAAGSGGRDRPLGVAPEADLVVVHSAPWDGKAGGKLGDSVTLLEAIDFIARAASDHPWVINLSMGRHGEQHDGSTLVEQALDAAVLGGPGRAICMSAGNYFDKLIHCAGQLRPTETRTFVWEVNEGDVTENELEVWYPGRDRMVVEIRSPDHMTVARVKLGERVKLTARGKEIGNVYHSVQDSRNLDNHIDIFLYESATPGPWDVTLVAEDVVDGRFHAWIERDAACPKCQSRFRSTDAQSHSTTGTICNGLRTIAVGAYDRHDPDLKLGRFSSSGPTRDGRLKPDLCAPGVSILAARSAARGAQEGGADLTRMSGTSMAAPHVTGTIALMFEAAPRRLRITETRNLLLQSTDRIKIPGENHRIGMGYLNVEAAVAAARAIGSAPAHREQEMLAPEAVGAELAEFEPPKESTTRTKCGQSEVGTTCDALEMVGKSRAGFPEALVDSADTVLAASHKSSSARVLGDAITRLGPSAADAPESIGSLSGLFEALERPLAGAIRTQHQELFDIIGVPGAPLRTTPRPGDVLVRRGDEGVSHYAVLASEAMSNERLVATDMRSEGREPGIYAQVVDGGALPHRLNDRFARRIAGESGLVESNQMLVRLAPTMWLLTGAALARSSPGTSATKSEPPEPDDSIEGESKLIASDKLNWAGATDEQLQFMRQVYDLHVGRASRGRPFVGDIPDSELELIEEGHLARRPTAQACRDLLVEARMQLQQEQQSNRAEALRVTALRVISAYRSASHQFRAWQRNFAHYYEETRSDRMAVPSGEHSGAAAQLLAHYVGVRLAAPGFSLHNNGLAIDFGTTDGGVRLGPSTSSSSIHSWLKSWFFGWLMANATRFGFFQNTSITEPWHWEHRSGSKTTPRPEQGWAA